MNNFDVLKEMAARNLDIRLASLGNIISARTVKAGTQITIGVEGNVCNGILSGQFVGGMILVRQDQFNAVKAELSKAPALRSQAEIEAEIEALSPIAKDYDTEKQSNDTCVAAGAHDTLRWILGLAEESVSKTLRSSLPPPGNDGDGAHGAQGE